MGRIFWRGMCLALPFLVLLAGGLGWRFYRSLEHEVVTRFSSHRWTVPSKIYAKPFLLYPGLDIDKAGLFEQLTHLEYRPVEEAARVRGDYHHDRQTGALTIFLRDFPFPHQSRQVQRLELALQDQQIERLVDLDRGIELLVVELEPEVITGVYDDAWKERRVVKLYDVPSLLVKALLAAEDHRFFEHEGIDLWRIIGAGWANLLAGRAVQGGSTLTQQLVKNFFLSHEKTVGRKLVEACMAIIVESHYSKLQVLENYLNEIYLGQRGAKSVFGVWEAARLYFGKEPHDLTLGEMAVLAGMIKAPNLYAPTRHLERALRRRNYVLQRMYELGDITQEEYQLAVQEPLETRDPQPDVNTAPYFADFVRKDLAEQYSSQVLTTAGLHIFTSLDMRLQRIAQEVVREGLHKLETAHPYLRRDTPDKRLQACLIAIQPQTGRIQAMVGGRDYLASQFNRASQAHRQPGSVFKPVVYLTALASEREHREGRLLPTSKVNDAPFTWRFGEKRWSPGNYNNRYKGWVTLRRALELSLNAATARVAKKVGLEPIRRSAWTLGFVSPLPLYPSLSLGAAEVTPLEVAVAYSTVANQGIRVSPLAITKITNQGGKTILQRTMEAEQVIPSEDAYMLTHLLEGVLERGTARRARTQGFERPAAGKTGTTNDYGDAWFIGYTPDLLTVVWVGFDLREPLKLAGGQAALPIWTEFMKRATAGLPVAEFAPPPGVTLVLIDRTTGYRATPYCPSVIKEAFLKGEVPEQDCPLHGLTRADPALDTPSFQPPPTSILHAPVQRESVLSPKESPAQPLPVPPAPKERSLWERIF